MKQSIIIILKIIIIIVIIIIGFHRSSIKVKVIKYGEY